LNCFDKVKVLDFQGTKTPEEDPPSSKNYTLPALTNLEELIFKCAEGQVLNLLKNAKGLKKIYIEPVGDDRCFPKLMAVQKNLEELTLNKCYDYFGKDISDLIEFKLKSLEISDCHFKNVANFEKFMLGQDKLEKVVLELNKPAKNPMGVIQGPMYTHRSVSTSFFIMQGRKPMKLDKILKHIFDLDSLKHLEIVFGKHTKFDIGMFEKPNENVKFLKFHFLDESVHYPELLDLLLKKFPNVKRLDIASSAHRCTLDDDKIKKIAETWKDLEELVITEPDDECLPVLKLENLRSLSLVQCEYLEYDGWKALADKCKKIDKLSVKECALLDPVSFRFILKTWKLKFLEINDCEDFELTDDLLKCIKEYGKDLKHFEFIGKSKLNENSKKYIDERQFKCEKAPFKFGTSNFGDLGARLG
jgi:hypothetical protein